MSTDSVYTSIWGGDKLNGWMVGWVVMRKGEDIAFGQDFTPYTKAHQLVQPASLQSYLDNHPSEFFIIRSFTPQRIKHLDWVTPKNATWELSFTQTAEEQNRMLPGQFRRDAQLARRITEGFLTEARECYRPARLGRQNGFGFTQNLVNAEEKAKKSRARSNKKQRDFFRKHFAESWNPIPATEPKQWVVATDGSYRNQENADVGMYAWVGHDGLYGRGILPRCDNSNIVELAAIFFAIMGAPNDASHIRVLTDSKNSISLINGDHVQTGNYGFIVSLIKHAMADKAITFEWVKGHRGHPLNHAADTLASRYRTGGGEEYLAGVVKRGVRHYAAGLTFAGDNYLFA